MSDLPVYPRHVTPAEVRADDPRAYRIAAVGIVMVAVASLCLVLAGLLQTESIAAPWLEPLAGLAIVISLWVGILGGALGIAMVAYLADVRRGVAMLRFARATGLHYARYGDELDLSGVFFTDRSAAADPLYRSEFELSAPSGLRTGIAVFTGGKNDRGGPRGRFRFLALRLPRRVPHLMIDSLSNGRLRSVLPGVQRLRLEGDVDRHFAVYAPVGYERDALQLLTPDVLVCLIDHGRAWDVEVVDDRVIVASDRFQRRRDAEEVPALLRFAALISAEIGTQAAFYTDPRAEVPRVQVSAGGRRLRRRSGGWNLAIILGVAAVVLAFPFVLMWLLDAF